MEWNVIRYDCNGRKIGFFNIFSHGGFIKDVEELFADSSLNDSEFEEKLRRSLQYYFWSRCEYEVIVSSWPRGDVDRKIDFFDQVMANWRHFLKYVKECRETYRQQEGLMET